MWYRFNLLLFRIWLLIQFRPQISGRAHEPPSPYLIIANHASAVDIPLVGMAVRAPVSFMAKEELAGHRFVRWWIRSVGSFFVRRGEADREPLRKSLEILQRGGVVCLFAEGTRSPDGRLQPLESGAAYLALHARVPVLPIAVIGTHRGMPKGARSPRSTRVTAAIGRPLLLAPAGDRITRADRERATAAMHTALSELLPPEQRPLEPATAAAPEVLGPIRSEEEEPAARSAARSRPAPHR